MIKFPKRYIDRCKYQRLDFDAPIKSEQWKNLYFQKDGFSHLGSKIYTTQQDAFNGFRDCFNEAKILGGYWNYINGRKKFFKFEEFSHCIQIPVKP